jgi:hypothetical protein
VITQQRATVGRTPLDEWSAPRRNLYLTTHKTDQHSCRRWDFLKCTLFCCLKHIYTQYTLVLITIPLSLR